jgi:type IV pilus assembly protein PilE
MKHELGFTLIEMMIAVAILAIITAIAIPAYNGYIRESRLGAMRMNLDTLRIAVEAFKLDSTNSTYKPANATKYYYTSSNTTIKAAYGWAPEGGNNNYEYLVYGPTATVYGIQAAEGTAYWLRCDKDSAAGTFICCDYTNSGCSKQN